MTNQEFDALISALTPDAKIALLAKMKASSNPYEEPPKPKRKKCNYQYHTVVMHYNFSCCLCGKRFTETHPFDILLEGEPKDHYEKPVSVLSCKYCEEELLKKDKECLVQLILSFTENFTKKPL